MQQFILEEHLDIIVCESGGEIDEVMHFERDDFIGIMLGMHQANSSRKWRLMVKNEKMKKYDLTLSTFVQYVEDFRFCVNAAGRAHRLPEKEIAKMFVTGLKSDLFREEIYSRSCETPRMRKPWMNQELNYLFIATFWRSQIDTDHCLLVQHLLLTYFQTLTLSVLMMNLKGLLQFMVT
jgi:hypothetical protein